MAFKIKQEKRAPEIESARAKLEEALQCIIEKADESPSTSEDEYNKGGNDISIKKDPSPVSSPVKKPQRTQRKRRRRDETLNKNANSYVMKLFDRAVDLTPFNEQTPLYPICRAWINNQELYKSTYLPKDEPPAEEVEALEDTNKGSEDISNDEVHQLPPPTPLQGKDLRIPSPIPQPQEEFTICSDEQNPVSKDSLMENHLLRWKAVRRKWKQAAKSNEERYKESATILKAIFERAQQQEETNPTEQQRWETLTPVT